MTVTTQEDHTPLPASPSQGYLRLEVMLPFWVLAASLAVTAFLWQLAHHSALLEQHAAFDARIHGVDDRIRHRIAYYEQVLHGVRGFYLNQHAMESAEFSGYIASLEIERNFPGMQAISFAPLVTDAKVPVHIASRRRAGMSDYRIRPEGRRASYAPVVFIEPLDERNARVLGFDNLSDPVRRATLEHARDSGVAALSEKLVLKQEAGGSHQTGFLLFLPVYQRNVVHDTLIQRREHIEGWFAAAFRMMDFMAAIQEADTDGINIEVFDDGVADEANRMYGKAPDMTAQFSLSEALDVGGRHWLVRYASLPSFEARRDRTMEYTALIGGLLLSGLLTLVSWLLMQGRRRAARMTQEIRRELEGRRQAELRMRELNLFNQAILDKSPSGIAVYQHSGQCVMVNEAYARAIGGTIEQVLQQNFRTNDSWQRNGLLDCANRAFDSGLTIRRDIAGETTYGKKVAVECIFSPILVSGRDHLLIIVNDVSDRVAAEQALTRSMHQLEEKELAKTRFLAAAGHDLRQPLAAANLFVDALKLTEATPRQQAIIQRLDQSMATFNGLLDTLLNVSKLDAGMIRPEPAAIAVSEVFNWIEQNFAHVAADKGLALRLYFPLRSALRVHTDQGLLQSVLMNLVSNAIKFTERGAVLVSARRRGNDVLFQVWDSGKGIEAEHIERIFDEFYQVDNPQRDRSAGLGLGLSIVRRALSLLGTEVACRSRPGRGSVFEFRLPQEPSASAAASPAGAQPMRVAHEDFARGKRIVLVEDDLLVSQAMLNWLEGMGAEVMSFHSAEEALRHAAIDHADYFIADYMLGGQVNGIQFLNQVRRKVGRPIRAVLVTGDTSATFIRHAVECDWPVLHKPINTSQLALQLSAQGRAEAGKAG